MQSKDLGFDKEQVLVVHRADGLRQNHQTFKEELLKHPEIKSISFSLNTPARHHNDQGHHFKGHPEYQYTSFYVAWGDFDFIETLNLEIAEGRNFDINRPTDYNKVIINEAGVKALETEDALNGIFDDSPWPAFDSIQYEIIGVLKNFHFQSLNHNIDSWILYPLHDDIRFYADCINIKIQSENISSTINLIKESWMEHSQDYPFEYSFLDEDFNELFQKELREKRMYTVFSLLAVIISCLGLLGLASFTANQKTKEIGIRKSMGSTAWQVQGLLIKQFSLRILISIVIASVGGYYLLNNWLENFAFRINMPYGIFILSGLIAFLIALITVSYHSYTAAMRNPVTALRYE